MKYVAFIMLIFASSPILSGELTEQSQPLNEVNNVVKSETKNVLLFPLLAVDSNSDREYTEEVMDILTSASMELRRFSLLSEAQFRESSAYKEVVGGENIESSIIEASRKLNVEEVLLVTNINLQQVGVPPEGSEKEKNRSFVENLIDIMIFSNGDEQYANNIQSLLSVNIKKINSQTGDVIGSQVIDAGYTGGNRSKSKSEVYKLFKAQAQKQLLSFYPVNGVTLKENNKNILLQKGSVNGVKKGQLYQIYQKDNVANIEGQETVMPGRQVAIAKAIDVSETSSRLSIIRQWDELENIGKTEEFLSDVTSFNLYASSDVDIANPSIGFEYMFKPLSDLDYGFGAGYQRALDSRDSRNNGLSLDFVGAMHFYRTRYAAFSLKSGVSMFLAFRDDDKNHFVTNVNFGIPLLFNVEHKVNRNWNVFVSLGQLFTGDGLGWQQSTSGNETQGSKSGEWDGNEPNIDFSGFYIKLGVSKLNF